MNLSSTTLRTSVDVILVVALALWASITYWVVRVDHRIHIPQTWALSIVILPVACIFFMLIFSRYPTKKSITAFLILSSTLSFAEVPAQINYRVSLADCDLGRGCACYEAAFVDAIFLPISSTEDAVRQNREHLLSRGCRLGCRAACVGLMVPR